MIERCSKCRHDVRSDKPHPCEYLRRNLLVASASGARAGVSSVLRDVQHLKRPPKWLVRRLEAILERLDELPAELAAHRDEIRL